jgi:hypothetical protein
VNPTPEAFASWKTAKLQHEFEKMEKREIRLETAAAL